MFQNILRASTGRIDRDTDPDEYDRQLQEEAEQIVSAWRDASNDLRKSLREALFEGVALAAETVKTLVKGPEVFELVIVGGLGLWNLKSKIGQFAESRRKGHHFLSQIHRAESDVLQIQYPLGLTE